MYCGSEIYNFVNHNISKTHSKTYVKIIVCKYIDLFVTYNRTY